jgi:hypothetical protein
MAHLAGVGKFQRHLDTHAVISFVAALRLWRADVEAEIAEADGQGLPGYR